MTSNDAGDGEVLPCLLGQFDDQIDQLSADGAYDAKECHQELLNHNAKATIPPCKNARPWKNVSCGSPHLRNQILEELKAKGRKKWKEESGYHRRSLSETAMFRYKTIIGDKLTARLPDSQSVETHIGCNILSKITSVLLENLVATKIGSQLT
jgi:hypothetical protein